MAKQVFVPKVGDIVHSKELEGVFKVVAVQVGGEKCFIQEFNVSKHVLLDGLQILVEHGSLVPFHEDESQAAARIVREATE